jgi:hypothetical protein
MGFGMGIHMHTPQLSLKNVIEQGCAGLLRASDYATLNLDRSTLGSLRETKLYAYKYLRFLPRL